MAGGAVDDVCDLVLDLDVVEGGAEVVRTAGADVVAAPPADPVTLDVPLVPGSGKPLVAQSCSPTSWVAATVALVPAFGAKGKGERTLDVGRRAGRLAVGEALRDDALRADGALALDVRELAAGLRVALRDAVDLAAG